MKATDWQETTLGAEVDLLTGYPFPSSAYTAEADGIPLIRGDNVVQGQLRWDDVKKWSAAKANGLEAYFLQEGDVVLAMDRPWIEAGLKYARITEHDMPALLVQRVSRLRAKSTLEQSFLKYIIGSSEFTNHILAVQTGTAVPHISGNQIKEFRFLRPPIPEQRAIAHILGRLDDKIELNRRMNETLEGIARALFKSWFVDFDPVRAKAEGRQPAGMDAETAALFPDAFEDSVLGKIPRGWIVKPLDEIADFLNGLALQKFPPEGNESLPVIKIAELRKGVTSSSDRASAKLEPAYIVNDGDVLFSWSGSLDVVLWCGGKGALNQHLFKVTSNEYPKWFYYQWVLHHLPDFQFIAASKATTMGHIQRHHLSEAKVLVPSDSLFRAMDKIISPLLEKISANNVQARTIAALRDMLLPKLISGEVGLSGFIIQ